MNFKVMYVFVAMFAGVQLNGSQSQSQAGRTEGTWGQWFSDKKNAIEESEFWKEHGKKVKAGLKYGAGALGVYGTLKAINYADRKLAQHKPHWGEYQRSIASGIAAAPVAAATFWGFDKIHERESRIKQAKRNELIERAKKSPWFEKVKAGIASILADKEKFPGIVSDDYRIAQLVLNNESMFESGKFSDDQLKVFLTGYAEAIVRPNRKRVQ